MTGPEPVLIQSGPGNASGCSSMAKSMQVNGSPERRLSFVAWK